MRYRAPFQLFKKTLKSGSKIYYYTTYDSLNRRKQYSTGCKTKSEALVYCMEQFKKDQLIVDKSTIFSVYTAKWFIYDECPYIQSVLARGKKYSRASAAAKRSILLNKIYPYFQDMRLEHITPLHIENWLYEIKKLNISNTTINLYLSDLKLILKEAYRTDVIKSNPGLKVNRLVKNSKARGILTDAEVEALFDINKKNEIWEDEGIYLMNLIASQTGMRVEKFSHYRLRIYIKIILL